MPPEEVQCGRPAVYPHGMHQQTGFRNKANMFIQLKSGVVCLWTDNSHIWKTAWHNKIGKFLLSASKKSLIYNEKMLDFIR